MHPDRPAVLLTFDYFATMSGATEPVDWAALNAKLPYAKNSKEKKARKKLFNQFDPNGNGYLSLAEVRHRKK